MRLQKTVVIFIVIVSFLCAYSPAIAQAKYYAATKTTQVTQNSPQLRTTPPEPIVAGAESGGSGKKVLWGVLGAAAVIGLIAAVVGGGSSGSSGSTSDDPEREDPSTGSVQVEW